MKGELFPPEARTSGRSSTGIVRNRHTSRSRSPGVTRGVELARSYLVEIGAVPLLARLEALLVTRAASPA